MRVVVVVGDVFKVKVNFFNAGQPHSLWLNQWYLFLTLVFLRGGIRHASPDQVSLRSGEVKCM